MGQHNLLFSLTVVIVRVGTLQSLNDSEALAIQTYEVPRAGS